MPALAAPPLWTGIPFWGELRGRVGQQRPSYWPEWTGGATAWCMQHIVLGPCGSLVLLSCATCLSSMACILKPPVTLTLAVHKYDGYNTQKFYAFVGKADCSTPYNRLEFQHSRGALLAS